MTGDLFRTIAEIILCVAAAFGGGFAGARLNRG